MSASRLHCTELLYDTRNLYKKKTTERKELRQCKSIQNILVLVSHCQIAVFVTIRNSQTRLECSGQERRISLDIINLPLHFRTKTFRRYTPITDAVETVRHNDLNVWDDGGWELRLYRNSHGPVRLRGSVALNFALWMRRVVGCKRNWLWISAAR